MQLWTAKQGTQCAWLLLFAIRCPCQHRTPACAAGFFGHNCLGRPSLSISFQSAIPASVHVMKLNTSDAMLSGEDDCQGVLVAKSPMIDALLSHVNGQLYRAIEAQLICSETRATVRAKCQAACPDCVIVHCQFSHHGFSFVPWGYQAECF